MKIQIKDGPVVGYKHFTYPDGQPHIELAQEVINADVTITTAIRTPADLFNLCLVANVLEASNNLHLDLRYLMGGRMDKQIDSNQPLTLSVVGDIISNAAEWKSIRILDPHSEMSSNIFKQKVFGPIVKEYFPNREIRTLLSKYNSKDTAIIAPDKGAIRRIEKMFSSSLNWYDSPWEFIVFEKVRDQQTGEILSYKPTGNGNVDVRGKRTLIIDDICDGGATFKLCAKSLRDYGATSVDLFVTHGLFTKGLPLEGIDNVYTTNSVISSFVEELANETKNLLEVL